MKNLKQLMLVITALVSFPLYVSADVYTDEYGNKLEYRIINGNEVEITKAEASSIGDGSVRIPDFISELPVTSIGESAFAFTGFKEVVLPDNLKSIGESAFESSGLKSIEFPQSLESIGASAFKDTGLTAVEWPDKVTEIPESCFEDCDCLVSVKIPETVLSIGARAFCIVYSDSELLSIDLPTSLISIGEYAFSRRPLTSVDIPATVTSIG